MEIITLQQVLSQFCKQLKKSKNKVALEIGIAKSTFSNFGTSCNLTLTMANKISDYFLEQEIEIDPIVLLRLQEGQLTLNDFKNLNNL